MPPRVGKDGVYGGRDALHAAISSDEGKTWRGFREVYRDPTRNGSPPKTGDRGTAYPHATLTKDGQILLVSGQGENRRRRFLIEPQWLLETHAEASFENLDQWHVFKGFGPAAGFWRDRVAGAQLVDHPDQPGGKARTSAGPTSAMPTGRAGIFPRGPAARCHCACGLRRDRKARIFHWPTGSSIRAMIRGSRSRFGPLRSWATVRCRRMCGWPTASGTRSR
jgi:hypothetical protein